MGSFERFPRPFPPPFADAWGDDESSLWAEFEPPTTEYFRFGESRFGEPLSEPGAPVVQRMRWIEPGSFWMGSPEDEPGRRDDEGPRHLATLTRGFWLADTACTQALWQSVMDGEDPSHFKGVDRPVERVNWEDVQRFLRALEALLPGALPACRPKPSGSTSAAPAPTRPSASASRLRPIRRTTTATTPVPAARKALIAEKRCR